MSCWKRSRNNYSDGGRSLLLTFADFWMQKHIRSAQPNRRFAPAYTRCTTKLGNSLTSAKRPVQAVCETALCASMCPVPTLMRYNEHSLKGSQTEPPGAHIFARMCMPDG